MVDAVQGNKPKIILDCDPGHDDAIAILLALEHSHLLAITTVSGNAPLEATTFNALATLTVVGRSEVPVHAGASAPLTCQPKYAPEIHGESGLAGPQLPAVSARPASDDAVRYLIDTARAQDDLWLVAIGPLTNVALALRQAPDIAYKLAGISIMGGSATFGNRTPSAEFNIWADPEAAHIVFESGAKIIMSGLNLTHQFMLSPADVSEICEQGNAASVFVADMLEYYGNAYADTFFGRQESPLHDPCAVLAVTHPTLIESHLRRVDVELTGSKTRGMTIVDERGLDHDDKPRNVHVGYNIDRYRALAVLKETLAILP